MPGSDREYDLVRVKDASSNSKADTFFVAPKHVGRDGAGTERMVMAETDEPPTPEAGEQYLFLGTDGTLKAKFADGSVTPIGGADSAPDDAEYVTLASDPDLSAESLHQNLTGAQLHDPALHSVSHQDGGADELDVSGLSGVLADAQAPVDHALGGTFHTADTLANLNTLVSDATLDGTTDPRDPTTHSLTHENGGTDEINVAGLSGDLADPQDPKAHASTHSDGGADEITVENLGTGGAAGTVPTSDGAGGLSMSAVSGDATSDACRVRLSSDQSVSANTDTKIAFDVEGYDTGNNFSTVTNAYTCPQDGVYGVAGTTQFSGGGTSDTRQLFIGDETARNPGSVGMTDRRVSSSSGEQLTVSGVHNYTTGDTIALWVVNSGSSDSIKGGANNFDSSLEIVYLGNP